MEPCPHREVVASRCVACGACVHELILNGACDACGATDVVLDHRGAAPGPAIVPAERLRQRRDR